MMTNLFKWSLRVLIVCGGIGCLLKAALLGASGTPSIMIAQTNYNFGELSETTPLSHVFIVKNAGKSTLNVRDVEPG